MHFIGSMSRKLEARFSRLLAQGAPAKLLGHSLHSFTLCGSIPHAGSLCMADRTQPSTDTNSSPILPQQFPNPTLPFAFSFKFSFPPVPSTVYEECHCVSKNIKVCFYPFYYIFIVQCLTYFYIFPCILNLILCFSFSFITCNIGKIGYQKSKLRY